MHAVVAAFHIYAQGGEDAAKTRGWRPCIKVMNITSLIMEKSWNCVFDFCGNSGINTIEHNIAFKAAERLHQDQWQFSCHQIRCNVTLMLYSVFPNRKKCH